MAIKQTAGHDQLGEFAPLFAEINDDVLFGQVWNDGALDPKMRSMLTVTTLVAKGLVDQSFEHHMAFAKATVFLLKRWQRFSLMLRFMLAGQMHGQHSALLKAFMVIKW